FWASTTSGSRINSRASTSALPASSPPAWSTRFWRDLRSCQCGIRRIARVSETVRVSLQAAEHTDDAGTGGFGDRLQGREDRRLGCLTASRKRLVADTTGRR